MEQKTGAPFALEALSSKLDDHAESFHLGAASAIDGRRLKLLVVDESVVFCKVIRDLFDDSPEVEVVGVAANGKIALDKIETLKPDLITLDVEMPVLDGLGLLREIRERQIDVGHYTQCSYKRRC